ncbi:MAG: amino acid permease [Phycisphaerales bacterium]
MFESLRKELSLFDSTCLVVGIIIGAGIYETAPTIAASMSSGLGVLAIWLVGGLLALSGALCYAELATTYPRAGGDYVYLNRAYGPWSGFLFAWAQLVIVRPGDIALLAFIFSRYAQTLYAPVGSITYAAAAVIAFTVINIVSVRTGKWTQNVLTVTKIVGMLVMIVVSLLAPGPPATTAAQPPVTMGGLELALILVLFTFGGWSELGYVAAEVKRPHRNIVRALVSSIAVVTALYVLMNGAFLYALGLSNMAVSEAVAVDAVATVLPKVAEKAIAILVCISALGAINGVVFTGARISSALGAEHAPLRVLGRWNRHRGTPTWSLIVQGCLSLAIVLLAGSFIDTILYTAPVVWIFFLATALSVFVLRRKDRRTPRPYKIAGHPATTIIYSACCIFMIYSAVSYALAQKPIGLIASASVVLIGALVYRLIRPCSNARPNVRAAVRK